MDILTKGFFGSNGFIYDPVWLFLGFPLNGGVEKLWRVKLLITSPEKVQNVKKCKDNIFREFNYAQNEIKTYVSSNSLLRYIRLKLWQFTISVEISGKNCFTFEEDKKMPKFPFWVILLLPKTFPLLRWGRKSRIPSHNVS